jgi:aromatic ring-cleaving dioxygenase
MVAKEEELRRECVVAVVAVVAWRVEGNGATSVLCHSMTVSDARLHQHKYAQQVAGVTKTESI